MEKRILLFVLLLILAIFLIQGIYSCTAPGREMRQFRFELYELIKD